MVLSLVVCSELFDGLIPVPNRRNMLLARQQGLVGWICRTPSKHDGLDLKNLAPKAVWHRASD